AASRRDETREQKRTYATSSTPGGATPSPVFALDSQPIQQIAQHQGDAALALLAEIIVAGHVPQGVVVGDQVGGAVAGLDDAQVDVRRDLADVLLVGAGEHGEVADPIEHVFVVAVGESIERGARL